MANKEYSRLVNLLQQNRGAAHYGAKCIYETMRYESAIADAEITFKLNNVHVSGLARLYNAVTGTDYFETREAIS